MTIRDAKNITSAWLSLLAHLAVGFFLSPFILHRLGDEAFGVWILIFSLTGYFGLLDFGIRQSVIRHVAKFTATGKEGQLSQCVNICLFVYGILSLLALLATGLCALYLPVLFRIPPPLLASARIVMIVVGCGVALSFPLGVFAGILAGLQEFYRAHSVQILFTLLRGVFVVVVLNHGGGLVGIALVTVGLNALSYACLIPVVTGRVRLHFGLRFIDKQAWIAIRQYSSLAFVIVLADRLRFQSDAVVIGILSSASAVTYFAIGSKLVELSGFLVQGLSQIFTPMSSGFEATGDLESLRKVLITGNRACAMTIFPVCCVLIILGKPIIEAWVGAKYLVSYPILLLLLLPKTLYLAQAGSVKVLLGTGRHRSLAFMLGLEGAANLLLNLFLIRHMGIFGVALGTALPLVCTSIFYLPHHVCGRFDIPLSTYFKDSYLLPLGFCAPLAATLMALHLLAPVPHYSTLFLQLAAGGTVYVLGQILVSRIQGRFRAA